MTTTPLDHDALLTRFWRRDTAPYTRSASIDPAYVSIAEAARMIGRSRNVVCYHYLRGQFAQPYLRHEYVAFRREDVEAWMDSQDQDRNYMKAKDV